MAKRQKQLIRAVNQAKLKQFRRSPVYKFGIEVPRDHWDAMRLDKQNGNAHWYDAEQIELAQIDEYETFRDHGYQQGMITNAK